MSKERDIVFSIPIKEMLTPNFVGMQDLSTLSENTEMFFITRLSDKGLSLSIRIVKDRENLDGTPAEKCKDFKDISQMWLDFVKKANEKAESKKES